MKIDFAWAVYIGVRIGFTEEETARMYYGKWAALYGCWRKEWNMKAQKAVFKDKGKTGRASALDL